MYHDTGYDLNCTVNRNKYEFAIANQYNLCYIYLIVLCTEYTHNTYNILLLGQDFNAKCIIVWVLLYST